MICPSCRRTFISGPCCTEDGWKLIKVACPACKRDTFGTYCSCGEFVSELREAMIQQAINDAANDEGVYL